MSSRGFHACYRKEGSFPAQTPKLSGVDIKAGGTGYIVVPPRIHASGHQYAWDDANPSVASLRCEQLRSSADCSRPLASHKPLIIAEGSRNTALASLAGYLRYKGFSDQQMLPALKELNSAACHPPLADVEPTHIARSISKHSTDHEEAFGNLSIVAICSSFVADQLAAGRSDASDSQ